jgi:hypothetical protein
MARRARVPEVDALDALPGWLSTYVQADWERPEDAEAVAKMGAEWGSVEFARRIHADQRYSAARREWAASHSLTLKELRALTGPTVSPAHIERTPVPSMSSTSKETENG